MAATDTTPTITREALAQLDPSEYKELPEPVEYSPYGSIPEMAKTFGENVASGYTLGGSEVLEQGALHNALEREARTRENPATALIGQGLGFLGAQATPGYGEALDVARLPGKAAAEALGAGKVGTSALSGAAAFGGMGAVQNAAHETSLGDPDLNAGKLLSAAGMGALYGAPVGLFAGILKGVLLARTTDVLDHFEPTEQSPEDIKFNAGEMSEKDELAYADRIGKEHAAYITALKALPAAEGAVREAVRPEEPDTSGATAPAAPTPLKPLTMKDFATTLGKNAALEFRNPLEAYRSITSPLSTIGSIAVGTVKDLFKASQSEVFNAIKGMLNESGEKIGDAAKAVFGSGEFGQGVDAAAWGLSSYAKNSERVQQLANDPEALMATTQAATKYMDKITPQLSQQIQQQMVEGVNFLNSKVPKPLNPQFLDQDWEPSKQQKIDFNEYFRTVDDPIASLKQIKNGGLTNKTMETLQSVFPGLLTHMRSEVMSNMDLAKALRMPFAGQIALAKFLGQPLSVGMTPQAVQANQQALAPQPLPSLPTGKAPKGRGSSAKHLAQASRATTETSREAEET